MKGKEVVKEVLNVILICLLGLASSIFICLYVATFNSGFVFEQSTAILSVAISLIALITILTIVFYKKSKKFVYKLFYLITFVLLFVSLGLYLLRVSGILEKFDSVDSFREYIASHGAFSVVLFIVIQFLQVVVLPIPAFITVGAGVLLFGPLKGAIFSCIGIIAGSIVGFYIGRIFGYKVAKWLVGADNLDKGLKMIKGKDKVILTFMFLFPFFPDDVLCFVAGITTVSPLFFIVMIFITRIISVSVSSFSMNNSIIPYDTWWGILLWILFFIFTAVVTILVYKHGEKIEKFFTKKKKKTDKTSKSK